MGSGQALAGLLAAVMSFITSYTRSADFCKGDVIYSCLDGEVDYSTLFFFTATVAIMMCCIFTLIKMLNMETIQPYISPVCTPNSTPVRNSRKSYGSTNSNNALNNHTLVNTQSNAACASNPNIFLKLLKKNTRSVTSSRDEIESRNVDNNGDGKTSNIGFVYTDLRDEYRSETGVDMPACTSRSPNTSLQFPKMYIESNDSGSSGTGMVTENDKPSRSVINNNNSSFFNHEVDNDYFTG